MNYRLNYSQEAVRLQRVLLPRSGEDTLAFRLDFRDGFDIAAMKQAVALLYERHDCLRLSFTGRGFFLRQHFAPSREPVPIQELSFEDQAEEEAFCKGFVNEPLSMHKGETMKLLFLSRPYAVPAIVVKLSHYAADLYGAGVMVSDLISVYEAICSGGELPPAPGDFETVLLRDMDSAARRRDRDFFRKFISRQPRPLYCGFDGGKKHRSPYFIPFDRLHQEAVRYSFDLPSSTLERLVDYVSGSGYSISSILFYACTVASSLQYKRAGNLSAMLLVHCRTRSSERSCAGSKVQALPAFLTVDYGKSFLENLAAIRGDMNELYRHTRYPFIRANMLLHLKWLFPPMGYIYSFCFSYFPQKLPDGLGMYLYNRDRVSQLSFIIAQHDFTSNTMTIHLLARRRLLDSARAKAFMDRLVEVQDKVLAAPDQALGKIFL